MNKHTTPLVSVIMPVYNAGAFIVSAIESMLQQTFQDFELIIIDDASSDGSTEIIRQFEKQYPHKITAIYSKKHLSGMGDSCANYGIEIARGTYIARMDADDIAVPTRLEKQVAFLQSHPDVLLVGSSAHVINAQGDIIGEKLTPTSAEAIRKEYFRFHPMIHPTCMYRRMLPNGEPFRYQTKFIGNNDYYTFFRLVAQGHQFRNLPEKLLYYRIHTTNASLLNVKEGFVTSLKIRSEMVMKYHFPVTPKDLLLLIAQAVIVFGLPNSILPKLFVLVRGYKKPATQVKKIKFSHLSPLPNTTLKVAK